MTWVVTHRYSGGEYDEEFDEHVDALNFAHECAWKACPRGERYLDGHWTVCNPDTGRYIRADESIEVTLV